MENTYQEYAGDQPDWEHTYGDESFGPAIEESEANFAEIYCMADDDEDETTDDADDTEDISDWGNNDPRTGGGDQPSAPGSAV